MADDIALFLDPTCSQKTLKNLDQWFRICHLSQSVWISNSFPQATLSHVERRSTSPKSWHLPVQSRPGRESQRRPPRRCDPWPCSPWWNRNSSFAQKFWGQNWANFEGIKMNQPWSSFIIWARVDSKFKDFAQRIPVRLPFGIPKFPIPSLSTSENPKKKGSNLVMINCSSTNKSINVESFKGFKISLLRQVATLDAKPKSTAVFSPDRKRPQRCYGTLANFNRVPMSQIATSSPIPIQPQNRNIKGEKDHLERKLYLGGGFYKSVQ